MFLWENTNSHFLEKSWKIYCQCLAVEAAWSDHRLIWESASPLLITLRNVLYNLSYFQWWKKPISMNHYYSKINKWYINRYNRQKWTGNNKQIDHSKSHENYLKVICLTDHWQEVLWFSQHVTFSSKRVKQKDSNSTKHVVHMLFILQAGHELTLQYQVLKILIFIIAS